MEPVLRMHSTKTQTESWELQKEACPGRDLAPEGRVDRGADRKSVQISLRVASPLGKTGVCVLQQIFVTRGKSWLASGSQIIKRYDLSLVMFPGLDRT